MFLPHWSLPGASTPPTPSHLCAQTRGQAGSAVGARFSAETEQRSHSCPDVPGPGQRLDTDEEDPGPDFKERPVWGEGRGHSLFQDDVCRVDSGGSWLCGGGGSGQCSCQEKLPR